MNIAMLQGVNERIKEDRVGCFMNEQLQVNLKTKGSSPCKFYAKRLFDIIFSVLAILVFVLPVLTIIFIIKVFYNHPVLFYQERVGKGKSVFRILKFQTLIDEKATKFGAFLRKTGLDELPQFINVLRGDMSIVGPRALTSSDIKRLKWDSGHYEQRWSIKPGITGMAQIYGGQNKKTSWFFDKKYISSPGLFNDLYLLAISFLMNIFGKTRIRRLIWKNKKLK
jgi:lipopolysaccharide/colanic/teichoic acid biosynthesis glycosyltransferase